MRTPAAPFIHVVLLTLLPVCALVWSAMAAACLETGFFISSAGTALAVSLYAWFNAGRISRDTMLLVYCLLACTIALAVTSLADLADFTILGDRLDGETGLLLGGVTAFVAVAVIATRNSRRFPGSLSRGAALALPAAWGVYNLFNDGIVPGYGWIISSASLGSVLLAYLLLGRCKDDLSDGQYLSVLAALSIFAYLSAPPVHDSLPGALAGSLLIFLAGVQFFVERRGDQAATRIAGVMLLYCGCSDMVHDLLFHGLGIDETVAGVPALLCGLLAIHWLRVRRAGLPRGVYWSSLLLFWLFGVTAIVPESHSDVLALPMLSALLLFVLVCIGHSSPRGPADAPSLRERFRSVLAAGGYAAAFAVTALWFTVSSWLLVYNAGPARMIALLEKTPLWPGDAAFIRLAMRDESLWREGVRALEQGDGEPVNDYLERVRPKKDRFSSIVDTVEHRRRDAGIDTESIGLNWVEAGSGLTLTKVDRTSPAGSAGLTRGDRVVRINGVRTKDLVDDAVRERLSGGWKADMPVSLDVVTRTGASRKVSMVIGDTVQDPPVSRVFQSGAGGAVGYLYLEGFNSARFRDIARHFEAFRDEGVRDLVLDLRYNHGGIVGNAAMLADLIAGGRLEGRLFVRVEHSLRYGDRDEEYLFDPRSASLDARRLVVLTTDETCSASEAVINGLRPHMRVYTVGSKTCGKPYVMEGIRFGDRTLLPVVARVLNSRGEGHYFRGIRPDYEAEDDLAHQLGDPREGMLKKALELLAADPAGL